MTSGATTGMATLCRVWVMAVTVGHEAPERKGWRVIIVVQSLFLLLLALGQTANMRRGFSTSGLRG